MAVEWSVYILQCADGSLYTGVARDLGKRLLQREGELKARASQLEETWLAQQEALEALAQA